MADEDQKDEGSAEGPAEAEEAPSARTDAAQPPELPISGEEQDVAELPPNHPLLQRAQEALFQQLTATKLRLEEELKEKRQALKDGKAAREQVGVELYGFQQHLAKLQLSLERSSERCAEVTAQREAADSDLRALRQRVAEEEALSASEQAKVDQLQQELERLGETLRQVEKYNEQVASELALTKHTAAATEGQVQQLERAKQDQDFLIDSLEQQLGRLGRQLELHSARLDAQRRETRAAQEFLAKAVSDMEGVQFEKRQLVSQWKSSLLAMQRRDEAYELIQDAIHQQKEQQFSIATEMERYRRDAGKAQQQNEQRAAVLKRLEEQTQILGKQIDRVKAKQMQLQAEHEMAKQQLALEEAALANATQEGTQLAVQKQELEKKFVKTTQAIQALEQQLLDQLAEQTSAEKSAQRTVADTKALRASIQQKEAQLQDLQGQLDKMQGDYDSTQVHNSQLAATLQQLDGVIAERSSTIASMDADMKQRNTAIEQKTRELDQLNRKLIKLTENAKDAETGPLEATINNYQRQIAAKTKEGRELQRRWIVMQGQLVGLQAENAELAESIAKMQAEQAIMQHKRQRLSQQLHQQESEIAGLGKTLTGLHSETAKLNSLLAETTGLHTSLNEDNFLLETKITNQLKDMEEQWASLQSQIEALRAEKKEIVASVVEAEKEVLVMERKVQLEREMQDAIDPNYGNEETTVLRKEISRLQHRYGELLSEQERLVQEMERAVMKRDIMAMKGGASQSQKVQDMTVGQLKKSASDLRKGLCQAERERQAVEARLEELGAELERLQSNMQEADANCAQLRQAQAGIRGELDVLGLRKFQVLMATKARQKEAKRYEEVEAGKYKLHVAQSAALPAELEKAQQKQEKIKAVVRGLLDSEQELQGQLHRVLVIPEAV
ncbi:hypothetical protein N2152v2_004368 [Parachlorella kessleri]